MFDTPSVCVKFAASSIVATCKWLSENWKKAAASPILGKCARTTPSSYNWPPICTSPKKTQPTWSARMDAKSWNIVPPRLPNRLLQKLQMLQRPPCPLPLPPRACRRGSACPVVPPACNCRRFQVPWAFKNLLPFLAFGVQWLHVFLSSFLPVNACPHGTHFSLCSHPSQLRWLWGLHTVQHFLGKDNGISHFDRRRSSIPILHRKIVHPCSSCGYVPPYRHRRHRTRKNGSSNWR